MTFSVSPSFRLRRTLSLALGVAAAAALAPQFAAAQQFPTKQVRIISPFPVGGGPDGVARLVADKLSRTWGTGVIVENRPGGNGFIAIDAWKRGAKDGHDLLILDNVHLAAYPSLFKKLPYDPAKDFDTLLPLFKTHFFFTVGTGSKYKTVADIVADAKARPGKLNYGSWSVGNPVHLGSALLESMNHRPGWVGISALSITPSTLHFLPIFWMLPSAFSSMVVRPPRMLPLVGWLSDRSLVLWRLITSW